MRDAAGVVTMIRGLDPPERRTWLWAGLAVVAGVAMYLGLELREEPGLSAVDLAFEALETLPVVLTTVGVVMLFRLAAHQRQDQLDLLRELELARAQGQRWRREARVFIDGLGHAIDTQFAHWGLTDAEREVALLLLKGLSLKEISTVRSTSERTVRTQARALYGKSGLEGRAALSAFFLEDLLVPTEPVRAVT